MTGIFFGGGGEILANFDLKKMTQIRQISKKLKLKSKSTYFCNKFQ
jgi:hypothetical protein